jgi:DNA-binding NarL/FixJ family response regulator
VVSSGAGHPTDDENAHVTAQPADARLRVVLADDHYLVREGVRRLLESSGQVEVVAAVGNAAQLLERVGELKPDAIMTDIRMPPGHHMEGIEAAHRIRAEHPDIGVVVLSQHADESYAFELLKNGTDGLAYLLKDRVGDLDELLRALRDVVAGRSAIDARVVDALVTRRERRDRSGLENLTPRESDVLREMAQGKSNAGIAAALVLSESAVEKHVSSILAKLGRADEEGVHRRVAAVLAFLQG